MLLLVKANTQQLFLFFLTIIRLNSGHICGLTGEKQNTIVVLNRPKFIKFVYLKGSLHHIGLVARIQIVLDKRIFNSRVLLPRKDKMCSINQKILRKLKKNIRAVAFCVSLRFWIFDIFSAYLTSVPIGFFFKRVMVPVPCRFEESTSHFRVGTLRLSGSRFSS